MGCRRPRRASGGGCRSVAGPNGDQTFQSWGTPALGEPKAIAVTLRHLDRFLFVDHRGALGCRNGFAYEQRTAE